MKEGLAEVHKFPDDSLETIANTIASQFTTRELSDNNRPGYQA